MHLCIDYNTLYSCAYGQDTYFKKLLTSTQFLFFLIKRKLVRKYFKSKYSLLSHHGKMQTRKLQLREA